MEKQTQEKQTITQAELQAGKTQWQYEYARIACILFLVAWFLVGLYIAILSTVFYSLWAKKDYDKRMVEVLNTYNVVD